MDTHTNHTYLNILIWLRDNRTKVFAPLIAMSFAFAFVIHIPTNGGYLLLWFLFGSCPIAAAALLVAATIKRYPDNTFGSRHSWSDIAIYVVAMTLPCGGLGLTANALLPNRGTKSITGEIVELKRSSSGTTMARAQVIEQVSGHYFSFLSTNRDLNDYEIGDIVSQRYHIGFFGIPYVWLRDTFH